MSTETEARLERIKISKANYRDRNRDQVRMANRLNRERPEAKERRRELYHLTRSAMVEQGLVEQRGPGRPKIYATKEEGLAARRERAVAIRERWRELRAQLAAPPARSAA